MKTLSLISFLLIFSISVLAQSTTIVNDTIYPYGNYQSQFYHVFKQDSNYVVEGYVTAQNTSPSRKVFMKLDPNGNVLKKKQFSDSLVEIGGKYYNTVIETSYGYLNATNYRDSVNNYCLLLAINFDLDTLWTKRIHPNYFSSVSNVSYFTDIKVTPDGGYIASGIYKVANTNFDYYPFLIKLSITGDIQWLKKFETSDYKTVKFRRVELTPDLGIMLLTSKNQCSVIKTTALGNVQWITEIPNDSIYAEDGDMKLLEGSDDFIIACPYMYEFIPGSQNYGTILIGNSVSSVNYLTGELNWEKKHKPFHNFQFYPTFQLHTFGDQFTVSATASYILSPISNENHDAGVLLSYDNNGDSIGASFYSHPVANTNWLNYVLFESDGSVTGVGSAVEANAGTSMAAWFFRSNDYLYLSNNEAILEKENKIIIFPNPTSESFTVLADQKISLSIYSFDGRLIINSVSKEVNIKEFPNGIYFIVIKDKEGKVISTNKLIKK